MFINSAQQKRIAKVLLTAISISSLIPWQAQQALGQSNLQSFKVVVNSDRDLINPDQELTLREAIAIVNNTLPWAELSLAEQEQVTTVDHSDASRIEFDLNTPVKIELESIL
ncbi:MAG: hypothetical protein WBM86_06100, partial [Waterburya sp.]